MVPDHILNPLVERRIKQSDCKVNGWIMEGFGYTKSQQNLLKALKIKPSTVIMLEQNEDESIRRSGNKRCDPQTGAMYNLEICPPDTEAVSNRLVSKAQDAPEIVKKRNEIYKRQIAVIDEHYKLIIQVCHAETNLDQLTETLEDILTNPKG